MYLFYLRKILMASSKLWQLLIIYLYNRTTHIILVHNRIIYKKYNTLNVQEWETQMEKEKKRKENKIPS